VQPVGGKTVRHVDVRIVSASNKDLRRLVESGEFREDLYYRLKVLTVRLPPLRQRKEDIPALVAHFVDKYARENDKPVTAVMPEALQALLDYDWPGNVRELENVIERGVVLTTASTIGRELIPDHVRSAPSFHVPHVTVPPEGISLRDVIANFEKRLIESTLESTRGVQKEAARLLGLKPTTLNEMIKRHNILLPRDRDRDRRPVKEADQAEKPAPA
jgi:DNA-binding NtrC family response regulator